MRQHDHLRTEPIAAHAYTMPVVRELPTASGASAALQEPHGQAQPLVYAADAHAW
jgi:hypothetical protein